MLQDGKIKFFAPTSYDDEPFEPPPAYSEISTPGPSPSSSSLPSTSSAGQRTKVQDGLWEFQERIHEAMTQNHQDRLTYGSEEDREIRRQLMHLMSEFLGKVSKDSPKSIKDLPASVHGILKADLYMAPQEAVPLSSGWHLSGVSPRDDEIIGRAVQEGRVWPTETQSSKLKKESEASGAGSQSKPDHEAGLWAAVDGLSLDEAVCEPRGTLWWNDEREAQQVARALDLQLLSCRNTYVQINMRAEYMTFRRENEMGLWESKSGWTIVMAVTLLY